MLVGGRFSETGLFRHLSKHNFRVRNFGNTKALRVIFFSKSSKFNLDIKNSVKKKSFCLKLWSSSFLSKCSKSNLDFKNAAKIWEKVFCFWDNCIWIGIVKLSLLRTGYISSAANVLAGRVKSFHVNKRDFFQLNWLGGDNEYDKGDVMQISTVLGHVYHVDCRRVLWKGSS